MLLRPPNVQGSNPIEKDRRPTDKQCGFIISFILILWFVIGLYSVFHFNESSNDSIDGFVKLRRALKKSISLIANPFKSVDRCFIFVMVLGFSMALTWLALLIYKVWTKFFMWFSVIFSPFQLHSFISALRTMLQAKNETEQFAGMWSAFISLIFLMPLIGGIPSLYTIGMNPVRDIIKNSCRVLLGSPIIIPILSIFLVLEYLLLVFMFKVLVTVIISDSSIGIIVLICFFNFYGGFVMLSIVSKFARMLLSEHTINCYWENGEHPGIEESIARLTRYHMGTIMISSIWPITFYCGVVEAIKYEPAWEKKENNFFYLLTNFLLVWRIEETTSIFTTIYGTDFLQSCRTVFDSILRRCKLYLATSWMMPPRELSFKSLFVIIFVITTTILYLMDSKGEAEHGEDHLLPTLYLASWGAIIPPILVFSSISTATEVLLINEILISNKQD